MSGAPRSGALRSGALRSGAPASGALRSGAPRSGALRSGALRSGAPRSGALRSGAIRSGAIRSGALRSGAPMSGALRSRALTRTAHGPLTDHSRTACLSIKQLQHAVIRALLKVANKGDQVAIRKLRLCLATSDIVARKALLHAIAELSDEYGDGRCPGGHIMNLRKAWAGVCDSCKRYAVAGSDVLGCRSWNF